MLIAIQTVDHADQNYPTTGDYTVQKSGDSVNIFIKVSKMKNWKYELLVGLHELVESALCYDAGIADDDIVAFDKRYEDARESMYGPNAPSLYGDAPVPARLRIYRDSYKCGCAITEVSEPGDDEHAPYHHQHVTATNLEYIMAVKLKVDWTEYENANLALYEEAKS